MHNTRPTKLNTIYYAIVVAVVDLSYPGGAWSILESSRKMCKNDLIVGGLVSASHELEKDPEKTCFIWK